jgi:hypothetical protein
MKTEMTVGKYIALELLDIFDEKSNSEFNGIRLNGKPLCGIKYIINSNETLTIPTQYEYNTFKLINNGVIECSGIITIISNCL